MENDNVFRPKAFWRDWSLVPRCIFFVLERLELAVWLFIDSRDPDEHPSEAEIARRVRADEDKVRLAIERLIELNMLAPEQREGYRIYHIPHPAYWRIEEVRALFEVDTGNTARLIPLKRKKAAEELHCE